MRAAPRDVFARDAAGMLWHQWYGPTDWSEWESMGVTVDGDPVASSWGPNRLDLFVRGADGGLRHASWDGNAWSWDR